MNTNTMTTDWESLIDKAKGLGREKDLKGSTDLFQRAYDLSRDFEQGDLRRGESAYYLAYGRYVGGDKVVASELFKESLQYFDLDITNAVKISHIHSILGDIYYGLKQFEAAEHHLKESIKIEKQFNIESWDSEQLLASVLFAQKKYEQSIPYFEKVLEQQKKLGLADAIPKTLSILAFLCRESGQPADEAKWQKENLKTRGLKSTPRNLPLEPLPNAIPPGWGADLLTHFMHSSQYNERANFANNHELCAQIITTNERFWATRENLAIPIAKLLGEREQIKDFSNLRVKPEEWLEIYFFLRCHASFMSASRLALAAQIPETYMILRGCLENAMYAFYVMNNEQYKQVWLNRHNSEEDYKKVRKLFMGNKIEEAIETQDPQLAQKVFALYDKAIDDGAHPNVNTFFDNALQLNTNGELLLAVSYLNPSHVESVLKQVKEIGETALALFAFVFPHLVE